MTETTDAFFEAHPPDSPGEVEHFDRGSKAVLYGAYFNAMAEEGMEMVERGELDDVDLIFALSSMAGLFHHAGERYSESGIILPDDMTTAHINNVLNGTINLVPEQFAMSPKDSAAQTSLADQLLPKDTRHQAAVAALNYQTFFNASTMAGAIETLGSDEIDELLERVASSSEAMPHLTVSNWAIGQIVAGIYRYAANIDRETRVRVVDVGSGPGATLAAIISSIDRLQDIDRRPELAISGLEATPVFAEQLRDFIDRDPALARLGLSPLHESSGESNHITEFGVVRTVLGDATNEFLRGGDASTKHDNDEITVVTGNYSWHRLPSSSKAEILRFISQQPNVVLLLGDLTNNTSAINRRYFNYGANGPLNAGNQNLGQQVQAFLGVESMIDIERQTPANLDPRLAERLVWEQHHNDGHLFMAATGKKARRSLHLQQA